MNILLNINNFSDEFAYDTLKEIIHPDMKVLIIPFSYHESWIDNAREFNKHYLPGKDEYEDIVKEFLNYGIKRKNIKILHYYWDSNRKCRNKIYNADIIFLTGGYPDRFLYRIDQKNIRKSIQKFPGIVMGTSAGAMIQFDKYHVTPEEEGQEYEYHEGLGLLSGFDIEVHYEDSFLHLSGLITDLKLHNTPIFALPNNGGMIVDGEDYCHLGDAFEIGAEDIEVMQEELDQIVEAEEK
ncbi:MAG: Type 1 glutamine amidotransferase-like domain-containing protein [Firmicutes bacterium]|nr:Type 1 glutamine amidotransferase-like domain-containing protein [Bacillota bacterium]